MEHSNEQVYKEAAVVLIPSQFMTNIEQQNKTGVLVYSNKAEVEDIDFNYKELVAVVPISQEEPLEIGCWILNSHDTLHKVVEEDVFSDADIASFKKVIAVSKPDNIHSFVPCIADDVAHLPKKFVEYYVERYNKEKTPITTVHIRYDCENKVMRNYVFPTDALICVNTAKNQSNTISDDYKSYKEAEEKALFYGTDEINQTQ